MRRRLLGGLAAVTLATRSLLAVAGPCGPPAPGEGPGSQPASYAFATELGSGVYDFCGRQLQIYRLPFSRTLDTHDADTPPLRLTLPVTVGFLDFSPRDVLASGLPSRIDSLSFVPGLELEFEMQPGWGLSPYARFGGSFASESLDAWLYAAGVHSELAWQRGSWHNRFSSDLGYAGASFRGELRSDHFARLRAGIELRRGSGWRRGAQEVDIGPYVRLDLFADAPRAPVGQVTASRAQLELGMSVGTRPGLRVHGLPLPRLGIGYRIAGEVSSWRLVIGTPL